VLGWASGAYKFKQLAKIEKYNQLKSLMAALRADTRWVKGHGTDIYNIRCDKLANLARKGLTEEKVDKPTKKSELKRLAS
jgi:ribonuclease HI